MSIGCARSETKVNAPVHTSLSVSCWITSESLSEGGDSFVKVLVFCSCFPFALCFFLAKFVQRMFEFQLIAY
jgi:hypothetical protein